MPGQQEEVAAAPIQPENLNPGAPAALPEQPRDFEAGTYQFVAEDLVMPETSTLEVPILENNLAIWLAALGVREFERAFGEQEFETVEELVKLR